MTRSDRLRTFQADYGRGFGWFVEQKDGTTVAALVDPQREDQFWYSYRVEPVEGEALPEVVFDAGFWHACDLDFRNRVTGEVVRTAFAGGMTPTRERPRVLMRALHTSLHPTLLEMVILWLRRRNGDAR